jgi:hypothetical protein
MFDVSRKNVKYSLPVMSTIAILSTLMISSMSFIPSSIALDLGLVSKDFNVGSIDNDEVNNNVNVNNGTGPTTEEPPDEKPGTLLVTKTVDCQSFTFKATCDVVDSNFEPRDFMITVTSQNTILSQFEGSSSGTEVSLNPGSYDVTEDITGVQEKFVEVDDNGNNIPGGVFILIRTTSLSDDCSGTISAGETKMCTITNSVGVTN